MNDYWGLNDYIEGSIMDELVGETIVSIEGKVGGEEIIFTSDKGVVTKFYHSQDCCEWVRVEDINGDWEDLLNTPLVVAEERTEEGNNAPESQTYTFYTFRTIKGTVTVRWNGESNGYYSEAVTVERTWPDGVVHSQTVGSNIWVGEIQ